MQNRSWLGSGDGGERDIPPARTQCFSKSVRDFALKAAMNPFATATMSSTSSDGSGWRFVLG